MSCYRTNNELDNLLLFEINSNNVAWNANLCNGKMHSLNSYVAAQWHHATVYCIEISYGKLNCVALQHLIVAKYLWERAYIYCKQRAHRYMKQTLMTINIKNVVPLKNYTRIRQTTKTSNKYTYEHWHTLMMVCVCVCVLVFIVLLIYVAENMIQIVVYHNENRK